MIGDRQLAKLVKFFIDAPSSMYKPEDIAITFGEARIRYVPVSSDLDATGNVDRAIYTKLMLDAAGLAAGSLLDTHFVVNESFNTYAMKPMKEGHRIAAIARLINAQKNRYTVEVRLIDENGMAIASGVGMYTKSATIMDQEAFDASDEQDDLQENTGIAYGAIWRSPFGFIHQN